MSLQDILTPGEKMLAECGPYYATSRRIIKYEGEGRPDSTHEIAYHELAGVEVVPETQPSHDGGGDSSRDQRHISSLRQGPRLHSHIGTDSRSPLVILRLQGKPGYYRLILKTPPSAPFSPSKEQGGPTIGSLLILLGLKTPPDETLWRLDTGRVVAS